MAYQPSQVILCQIHPFFFCYMDPIILPPAKGIHTFPKGICLKVNVIARLEFELAYYDSAVLSFNHYTMGTPPVSKAVKQDNHGLPKANKNTSSSLTESLSFIIVYDK